MKNTKVQKPVENTPRFFYGYILVGASFFYMVFMLGIFYSFGVFFKPLLNEFGWTRADTAAASSLNWIMQGALAFVVGRGTDRFGPRLMLAFCGFIFGLGYLLVSQMSALWQFYLLYGGMIAVGMGGAYIPIASTVVRWFVKRRSIMTGISFAGAGLGTLIGPPIANWLISIYDWRTSYIIQGIVALVSLTLLSQLMKTSPSQVGQRPYGDNVLKATTREDGKSFSLWEALGTSQFWLLFSIFYCVGFCANIILVHLVPHTTDLGFSAASAAGILGVVGGAGFIGRIIFGGIGDKIGNRRVSIVVFIVIGGSLLWLLGANEIWMLYFFSAIFGFVYIAISISQSAMVAALFGLKSHGLILGATTVGYCIGAAVGPFTAGYIFDVTGSYVPAFVASIIFTAIGMITSLLLKPTEKLGGKI